jgi:hypothetical protein
LDRGDEKCLKNFYGKTLRKATTWNLEEDEGITLKQILGIRVVTMVDGRNPLGVVTSGGLWD